MSVRIQTAVAGLVGLLVGHLGWLLLWEAFLDQVPAATYEVVRQSDAFGTIAGIAAAAMTLAPGILLSLAVSALAARFGSDATAQ